MLYYSNSKINLGLFVTEKRSDGFHNIETVFYPIPLKDGIEFIPSQKTSIDYSGIPVTCELEDNLIIKAFRLLQKDYQLPELAFALHKNVPHGAGLGGGSANASQTLIELNRFFELGLSEQALISYANKLGSDCAFFIKNQAVYATEKGNVFHDIELDLSHLNIALIVPDFGISTPEAYDGIRPNKTDKYLPDILKRPIEEWKNSLVNDFEHRLFIKHPTLGEIKQKLYDLGADYVAMSGSGSAIFALSKSPLQLDNIEFWKWQGHL